MDNFSWNCLNPSSKSNVHPCSLWKLGTRAKIHYSSGVNTPPEPFEQGGKPYFGKKGLSPHHLPHDFSRGRQTSNIPKIGSSYVSMDDILILLQSTEKLAIQHPPFLQSFIWLNWIKRILDISFHQPALTCSNKLLLMLSFCFTLLWIIFS